MRLALILSGRCNKLIGFYIEQQNSQEIVCKILIVSINWINENRHRLPPPTQNRCCKSLCQNSKMSPQKTPVEFWQKKAFQQAELNLLQASRSIFIIYIWIPVAPRRIGLLEIHKSGSYWRKLIRALPAEKPFFARQSLPLLLEQAVHGWRRKGVNGKPEKRFKPSPKSNCPGPLFDSGAGRFCFP